MSKLEAIAFHEAGHAVAAFELHRAIDSVSIVADEESGTFGHVKGRTLPRWLSQVLEWDESDLSLRDRKAFEDAIVTLLSGAIAEELFTGKPNPDGARSDNANVLDLTLRLGMEDEGFEEVDAYLTWA